jgi:predicted acylesterase/phospholipase RssA
VEYRHRYLVDGGVIDFIPIDEAQILGAQWIIASVVEGGSMELPQNVFLSLLQVIDIRGSILAKDAQKKAHFVIKPDVSEIKVADFEKCLQAGEIGLVEGSKRMNDAKKSLIIFSLEKILKKI